MAEPGIDVQVETNDAPPADAKKHPNTCPKCQSHYRDDELEENLWVCSHCGHHFPMRARARIVSLADEGSFTEEAADLRSDDPLDFFDLRPYGERLAEAELGTGLGEAIVIGRATVEGNACELAIMDFAFMGGSMGSAVGEKFARACDSAVEQGVPLVSVSASGGARMQEGILALMQLPKTIVSVADLHDAGCALHLGARTSDHRRRAGELCEPRRRAARGARSADVLRRPSGRPADDAREAARRLRPLRSEPPLRPRGRDRAEARAEAPPGAVAAPLRQWQVKPSSDSVTGSRS